MGQLMEKKITIVKAGGHILEDQDAQERFLADFASLPGYKILVHGGGNIATEIGEKMGLKSEYIQGRRITDEATIELVTMVYGGLINRKIVAQLQALDCNAIGLTGADGKLITGVKRPAGKIDYGWVGDLTTESVNTRTLATLLKAGMVPVIAPLSCSKEGQFLNTNADTIASVVAQAMARDWTVSLVFCFEKSGILSDPDSEDSVVPVLDQHGYESLQQEFSLSGGIFPKIDNAFEAAAAGVKQVRIGAASDLVCLVRSECEAGTRIVGEGS